MTHLPYILAAYAAALVAIGGLMLWCARAMRRAERAVDAQRR